MKITVTKWHIENGRQCSTRSCPIALAFLEQHPKKVECAVVTAEDISYWWEGDDNVKAFSLPQKARDFIVNFDNDRNSVKPFSFEVRDEN